VAFYEDKAARMSSGYATSRAAPFLVTSHGGHTIGGTNETKGSMKMK